MSLPLDGRGEEMPQTHSSTENLPPDLRSYPRRHADPCPERAWAGRRLAGVGHSADHVQPVHWSSWITISRALFWMNSPDQSWSWATRISLAARLRALLARISTHFSQSQ